MPYKSKFIPHSIIIDFFGKKWANYISINFLDSFMYVLNLFFKFLTSYSNYRLVFQDLCRRKNAQSLFWKRFYEDFAVIEITWTFVGVTAISAVYLLTSFVLSQAWAKINLASVSTFTPFIYLIAVQL